MLRYDRATVKQKGEPVVVFRGISAAGERLGSAALVRPTFFACRPSEFGRLPRYDPSGRLFLASEDPTPQEQARVLRQQESDLKFGVRTVNEIRAERGLPPVPWGDRPFRVQGPATD